MTSGVVPVAERLVRREVRAALHLKTIFFAGHRRIHAAANQQTSGDSFMPKSNPSISLSRAFEVHPPRPHSRHFHKINSHYCPITP